HANEIPKAKIDANKDVDKQVQALIDEIDRNPNLTDKEKQALKDRINQILQQGHNDINNALTKEEIEQAKAQLAQALQDIKDLVKAKEDAKQDVDKQVQALIDEIDQINKSDVTRLVLCGGKVYYDLLEKRREQNLTNVAIVRIEQLYPYPEQRLAEILAAYPNVKELVWAQEEPKNQGAWLFIAPRLYDDILKSGKQIRISFAGREASAAPACGSPYLHAKQQAQLINDALAIEAEQSGDSQ
ncbi:MAG: DUF1542 domain-containing protein, partial [Acinetobacter baumannii]|nr:DUF1542 domain-containing protein [Acinetobacter baumannii]